MISILIIHTRLDIMDAAHLLDKLDQFFAQDLSLDILLCIQRTRIDNIDKIESNIYKEFTVYHDTMDVNYYLHDRLIPHSDIEIHWRYKNDDICFCCFKQFSWISNKPYYCAYFRAYFCHICISKTRNLVILEPCQRMVIDRCSNEMFIPRQISYLAYEYIQKHKFEKFIILNHWIPESKSKQSNRKFLHLQSIDNNIFSCISFKIIRLMKKFENIIGLCSKSLDILKIFDISALSIFQKLLIRDLLFMILSNHSNLNNSLIITSLALFFHGNLFKPASLQADCYRISNLLDNIYGEYSSKCSALCPVCQDKRKPLDLNCAITCNRCKQQSHITCYSMRQCIGCFEMYHKTIRDVYDLR